jgi:hypothetical protein
MTAQEIKAKRESEEDRLRDEFAMAALSGLIPISTLKPEVNVGTCTNLAYQYADAMIAARKTHH